MSLDLFPVTVGGASLTSGSVPAGFTPAAPAPLHLDAHCLVLDKPAGLLSVPGRGPDKQDCLCVRAQAQWPDALVVHRLDMATSGLLLLARGAAMQRALSRAFEARRVRKRYVAVVAGRMPPPDTEDGWGEIDLPLGADWEMRPRQRVDALHGRPSVTRWRILERSARSTRVELEPVTGRTHQLRVHLLALGHPILGDTLYAPAGAPSAPPRLLLHASGLALDHPAGGAPLHLRSPPPF
ncbi:RluA family pseudouridine synthase [Ramlibacter sp. AN1015]|uniref:RluA family pseudouridine synthase n=1 Tax=Ramlibacter sp. AN1015 TaxID=3133428 RepID=UPI0030BFF5ED